MLKKNKYFFNFFLDILKKVKLFWLILFIQYSFISALYPIFNGKIIKNLVNSFSIYDSRKIMHFLFLFLLLQFFINFSTRMMYFAIYKVWPELKTYLYLKIYKVLSDKNFFLFENKTETYLISKIKGIVQFTEYIFITLKRTARQFLGIFAILVSMIFVDRILFLILFLLLLIGLFIMKRNLGKIVKSSLKSNESYHKVNAYIGDKIKNASNIIKYGNKDYEFDSLSKVIKNEPFKKHRFYHLQDLKFRILISFSYLLLMSLLLLVIFTFREKSILTPGDIPYIIILIIAFGDNFYDIAESFQSLIFDFGELRSSMRIINKVGYFEKKTKNIEVKNPSIEFKNVSFDYPNGNKVFKNLSFSIQPFEKIGIFGPSGAGKTTIIKLLTKKFLPTCGSIYIDKQNIFDFTIDSILENISFVSQEETLFFDKTVYENIIYGNLKASKKDIDFVIKNVYLDQLSYESLNEVINIENKISGGQKRKIMIARALLKNSPIMIFDESTSFLDSETEIKIIENIVNNYKTTTIIFISHNISNLRNLDRILDLS